jgi:hypothetical protein
MTSTLKSSAEDDALTVKWGAHEVQGLDPKRAEAIGLKLAIRRVGYGSASTEPPKMLQHEGTIARYCRRTAELMLQSSQYWKDIEVNTRETNAYYKQLLTESRVQEEAYRTATDILAKIVARPQLLNVWEISCPGLLRSKKRELALQTEGTYVYLDTLKVRGPACDAQHASPHKSPWPCLRASPDSRRHRAVALVASAPPPCGSHTGSDGAIAVRRSSHASSWSMTPSSHSRT